MTMDVNVFLIDMPAGSNEAVTPNEDGSYSIFINARLSAEGQTLAYEHAVRHIEEEDFRRTNADEIETIAHRPETAPSPAAPPAPAERYAQTIARLRRRRRKIKRDMAAMEKKIQFLQEQNHDFFAAAEYQKLYGGL